MSKIQVDTIDTRSGTATMQIGSTNTSTINIGVSGDTVNIPSGVTIANAGTATGFGAAGSIYFLARRGNSGQTVANDTYVTIQMDTEMEDSGSVFNPSTYKFTPGVVGKYFVFAQVCFSVDQGDDWDAGTLILDKNDAGYTDTNLKHSMSYITRRGSGDSVSSFYASQIFDMDADDTIRVQFQGTWAGASSNETVGYGKTYFGGFRIA